ncbi:MAG: NAD(P)H-hydrate dehydratase [Anaerolineaceae bacterium]|nr:MAG: NAD(P)H-hydrate dehydratase [Anaerolineaceae bacterium]
MKLVTVSEMKVIESQADASGLTYEQMMENAGRGLADIVHALGEDNGWEEVLGLVGPGNNGGDTLVALARLARAGWRARAYCVKRKTKKDELVQRLLGSGGEIILAEEDDESDSLAAFLETSDLLLDGLLGTGIQLPLKPEIANLLFSVQSILASLDEPPFIVAVDCPSGVDCDTGEVADETLPADLTVTMACVKQGLLRFPAFDLVGELDVVDIGLPPDLPALADIPRFAPDVEWVTDHLPPRPDDAHKGTFGTALIAAGSIAYTGAAYLSAKAAYRVGAGLVTLAVPAPLHAALAGHLPEATWIPLPHENGFIARAGAIAVAQNLGRATALLVGCGFGLEETTKDFLAKLLEAKLPTFVADADALKLLAQIPDWHAKLPALSVLTPHPGEMSVLTGLSKEDIQNNREFVAEKYAKEWGHIVVLKGAFTVIAVPDGRIAVLPFASAALARAGTGDVLAGIIVGLRAQGMDAFEAAVAGAWIHAQAGLAALSEAGSAASVLAGDVLDCINDVMVELSG